MARLKDLKVSIGLAKEGLTKLNSDLRSVKSNFRRNFGEIAGMAQTAGRNMAISITAPLAIMGAQSVKAFNEQAKAIAQVEAGLKSTGGQVGYTSTQLQQMASDLQTKTLFGDEEILQNATAQLLTFTNIAGTEFARSQKAALDLATRLDGDLKSASIMLGKALNDPVANLSAMSRAGVQFSEEQKELIKSLTETGDQAAAQTIILDELEKQYGGSAEAAAEAGTGGFKQLQNMIGDLQEQFGELIVEFLKPLIPMLKKVVELFAGMGTFGKVVTMVVATLAAAAGPVLMLVGSVGQAVTAFGLLKVAMLKVHAMGIAGMFTKIRTAVLAMNTALLANPFVAVAAGLTILTTAFIALHKAQKKARVETENLITRTRQLDKESAVLALNEQKRALEADLLALKRAKAVEEANAAQGALGDKFDKQIARGNVGRYSEQITTLTESLSALGEEIRARQNEVVGGVTPIVEPEDEDEDPDPLEEKKKKTEKLIAVEKSRMVQLGNLKEIENETAVDTLAAADANHKLKTSLVSVGESVEPVLSRLKQMGMYVADKLPGFFESAFGALSQGTKAFGDFMLQTLQRLLIKAAALAATFVVLSALMGGATGVAELTGGKAGFKAFMGAGMGLPMMSNGGLFTGASLAMVGEGPGTSMINPEVVAPLDKLQQMMGGGNVVVTGMIRGNDILLSNERSLLDRNRVRGF